MNRGGFGGGGRRGFGGGNGGGGGRGFGGGGRGFGDRRGGGGGFRGGGGGGGFRGGGRGGGRFGSRQEEGEPSEVIEFGNYVFPCEDQLVVKSTIERVPYFNSYVYLENKKPVGKIDEIFGPIRDYYISVTLTGDVHASSFSPKEKFYVDPNKLLPLERFTGNQSRGRGGGGGGRGRGRGGGGGGRGGGGRGFGGRGGGGRGFRGGRGGGGGGGFGRGGGGGGFGRGGGGGGFGNRGQGPPAKRMKFQ